MIRIGILEDNPDFGAFLRGMIEREADFECVFLAETLAGSQVQLERTSPDLLLVDIQLPDGSGVDLVTQAAKARPDCRILMMTMLHDRASTLASFEAGAHGYLLKDSPPERIVAAIREAVQGESPISPSVAKHLLHAFQRDTALPADGTALTPREQDVLHMLSRGLSYAEAASALSLSIHTFRDHIKAIYRKLDVNSKTEAIFEARQSGLIKPFD